MSLNVPPEFVIPKHFRTAFIAQGSGYDFSKLSKISDSIKFVTTESQCATMSEQELLEAIGLALLDFDPSQDIVVPVGHVAVNLLVGIAVQQVCHEKVQHVLYVAIYRGKEYAVTAIPTKVWKKSLHD